MENEADLDKEIQSWTVLEVLSWFAREFSEEEIQTFVNGIPTAAGRDFFSNILPPTVKSYMLVIHSLGEKKRCQLAKFISLHSRDPGIHNIVPWVLTYDTEIMKRNV